MRGRVTVEVIIHTLLGWGRILVRVYIVAYPDVDQSIAKEIKKEKGKFCSVHKPFWPSHV